jgi:hypothetical protein
MDTVKELKDLGLVYIFGDKCKDHITLEVYGDLRGDCGWVSRVYRGSDRFNNDRLEYFAWRTNMGVKPEFKGLIEYRKSGCNVIKKNQCQDLCWSTERASYIVRWRPHLAQSKKTVFDVDAHVSDASKAKPAFTQAMADAGGEFAPGQLVYIAQINTLTGIHCKRYFVREYWCKSWHQLEYLALGILFGSKSDAELKCKSLLGIDTRTDKEKAVDAMKEHCPYKGSWLTTYKPFAEILYDAGLVK